MTTRERLTRHAARLFSQRGYHGTSMGDLADSLGIQKASIYAHIQGKGDLLAELTLAGAAAFHLALDAALETSEDPVERIDAALVAHIKVVSRQLHVATVWLNEWRYLEGSPRKRFLAERHRYEDRIRELFDSAVAAKALRKDMDISHAVLLFFSVGNWAYTWLTPKMDAEQEARNFSGLLLNGMRAPAN